MSIKNYSKVFLLNLFFGTSFSLLCNDFIYTHFKKGQFEFFNMDGYFQSSAKTVLINHKQDEEKNDIMNDYYTYINRKLKEDRKLKAEKEFNIEKINSEINKEELNEFLNMKKRN